jgi:hypothetical protein
MYSRRSPATIELSPTKRICPSLISVRRLKVSRQRWGTRNGSTPSITSISATAVNKVLPTGAYCVKRHVRFRAARGATTYFPPLPPDLKYLKNSEFGSSTITSFLLLKLCRYASMLR